MSARDNSTVGRPRWFFPGLPYRPFFANGSDTPVTTLLRTGGAAERMSERMMCAENNRDFRLQSGLLELQISAFLTKKY